MHTSVRNLLTLTLSISLAFVIMLAPNTKTKAAPGCSGYRCPTFNVTGGGAVAPNGASTARTGGQDIFVGGEYDYGTCRVSDSGYQAGANKGAIFAFARQSGTGSNSDWGAIALGNVEGTSSDHGFVTYHISGSSYNDLTFANKDVSPWGGSFGGTSTKTNCLTDYYAKYVNSAKPVANVQIGTDASDYYTISPHQQTYTLLSGDVTLPLDTNNHYVIFTDGNVYINHNLKFDLGDTSSNVPSFVLVVKGGDIYIDKDVTQLDGWYIAEPDPATGKNGVIWTCHDGSTTDPDEPYIKANCQINPLTINGALYAQKIQLLRIYTSSNISNNNAAETINYSPEAGIGNAFFNSQGPGFTVDSIKSLPPVY